MAKLNSNGKLTKDMERELMKMKDEKPDIAPKLLKAETRYVWKAGVSFILRFSDASEYDVLANIDFSFENALEMQKLSFSDSVHTQSERSWTQILEWIKQCSLSHTACQTRATVPRSHWPTRLIAVGDSNSAKIKVCDTSTLNCSTLVYMTLSHCWGQHVPKQLLTENYSTCLEGIELNDLPKTFRDAVVMTRKLEVLYLWIDSLCIVQNSVTDWVSESSKMHNVYKNSHLNLAAAASPNATGGLFYPRSPLSTTPCTVKIGQGTDIKYAGSFYTPENERGAELVLLTRAWVFQERLLAPRTLLFGKEELHLECDELLGSETYPQRRKGLEKAADDIKEKFLRKHWRELHEKNSLRRFKVWSNMIKEYSEKKLTKFSDKLVAVAGLAAGLGKTWDSMDYLAGISPPRGLSYTVPSWSWASVNGPVYTSTDYQYTDGLIEVLGASVQAFDPSNPYSAVVNGCIQLKGPMVKATISKDSSGDRWNIEFAIDRKSVKENKESEEDESSPRSKISAWVKWDDRAMEIMAQAVNVYLVPFEAGLEKDQGLCLEGLLLFPTFLQNGQFRRLGFFEVRDDWYNWIKITSGSQISEYVNGSSWEMSPKEQAVVLDGCPQKRPLQEPTRPGYYVTLLDAQAWLKDFDETAGLQKFTSLLHKKPAQKNDRLRRIQEWMQHFKERSDQNIGENRSREDDPYCNGIADTTLCGRYGDGLRHDDYPQIDTCLRNIALAANAKQGDGLSAEFYKECHGDGYFTFQII